MSSSIVLYCIQGILALKKRVQSSLPHLPPQTGYLEQATTIVFVLLRPQFFSYPPSDFELWLKFFQYADLYSIQTMIGGFRKHGDQKTGRGMEKYLEDALSCLQAQGKHPYGRMQSTVRKLFYYTVFNNPHSLNLLPSCVTRLLENGHVIYPAKRVVWNGEKWEICTHYTL